MLDSPGVRLVAISDETGARGSLELVDRLCHLARPGSVGVLLRDRALSLARRLSLGQRLAHTAASTGQLLLVADRVDLALALGAGGVHLPAGGMLPSDVLRLAKFGWISRAQHDWDALPEEECHLLTHVFVSPVMAERKGRPALGLDGMSARLSELRQRAPGLLGCALGGVTSDNCRALLEAGAAAVCVMGGLRERGELERLVAVLDIAR